MSKWSDLWKAVLGVFVFVTCTLLWYWVISRWSIVAVLCAVIYTIAALVLFDKLLTDKGIRR